MIKRGKQFIYDSEEDALNHLMERNIEKRDTVSSKMKDLTGEIFGDLQAIRLVGINKVGASFWLCRCFGCEEKYYVIVASRSITSGDVKSCGCLNIKTRENLHTTHGMSRTSEYRAWASMLSRCYTESTTSYPSYGALGVGVSEDWKNSFEAFISDMGPKPEPSYILDRVDPKGDYCKENCRWVDITISSHNKGLFSSNSSGFKGVSSSHNGSWRAYITKEGKTYRKSGFLSAEEAAKWYDAKAVELYGESASTNKTLDLY